MRRVTRERDSSTYHKHLPTVRFPWGLELQNEVSEMIHSGNFSDLDFGIINPTRRKEINARLVDAGLPEITDESYTIPERIMAKFARKRQGEEKMTPEEIGQMMFSIFHGGKTRTVGSHNENTVGLLNYRPDNSGIGYVRGLKAFSVNSEPSNRTGKHRNKAYLLPV